MRMPPATSKPIKLLIVDDSAAFRLLLRNFLDGLGAEIVECGEGAKAAACFAAHKPDWVLMDMEMKPVDGLKATRSIKARFPKARILMLTEHIDDLPREEAIAAGAEEYVNKAELLRVRQIISK